MAAKNHENRLLILRALKRCGAHKLPQGALVETVRQLNSRDVSADDVELDLRWLESKGYVDWTKGELGDDEKRWFITEEGKRNL